MTTAARALPPMMMTVEEFHAWPGDGTGTRYELVEGQLRAQDAASDAHGTIVGNVLGLVQSHLRLTRPGCRIVVGLGIRPRLRAQWNHRIPDLGVTCAPNVAGSREMPEPIVLIEVLSPSNADDTWSNVPLYASVPSVVEILLIESTTVGAELLRRGADASWPQNPESIEPRQSVNLASIALDFPLAEAYRDTHLARPGDAT